LLGVTTDERRRVILHCAARLFSHYGQSKTTIADIAREAQVGIGTVYLVFPSKEAIVEELSSSAHDRVLEAMREVAEARAGDSFSERLAGVLETRVVMFQKLAEEGQHACELVHCKNGPVKSVHAKFREEERLLLQRVLEQAEASGELASLDAKRAAGLIQRAYATLSPPWLYEQPADEARRAAYEMCRLLMLGLATRGARGDDDPARPRARAKSAGAKKKTKPTRTR
jgi:AcrR family transcriptional regulator